MAVKEIRRTDRADKAYWVPLVTARGYQLVSRDVPYPERNKVSHARFELSLDRAGDLVEDNHAIRMAEPGASRGDYVYPENLVVIRA